MSVALIEKSSGGMKLSLFGDRLDLIECESFDDLYTLNFHLQTLAKKHGLKKGLLVVHDRDRNAVDLTLAEGENSFFVS